MSPFRLLATAWLLAVALIPLGCAGELENPERFTTTAGDGDGDGDGCEPGDEPAFLAATCGASLCHDADAPAGGLDLVSADVAARLVDVASECDGSPLVDSSDPGGGLLLDKLGPQPTCGGAMPPGAPLSADDFACIAGWVEEL